jgi:hypothetical protein
LRVIAEKRRSSTLGTSGITTTLYFLIAATRSKELVTLRKTIFEPNDNGVNRPSVC